MHLSGWIIMLGSWSAILLLCGFCFWKVLLTRKHNIHAPLDINTGASDDERPPDLTL